MNGGSLIAQTQLLKYKIARNGNIISSPNVQHSTKRFVGWSLAKDGEVISLQDVSMTGNLTLYAVFEDYIPVPEKGTNQGRYMSIYHIESISQNGTYVVLKQVDNIGTINEIVSVQDLNNENFELISFDDYIYEEKIFQGQFLIVPKKDKSVRLNNLIISYTEFNWIGAAMLLLVFVTLMWVFIDNSSRKSKFIIWAGLLLVATVILFLLPSMINFSSYLEYLLAESKNVDPAATTITTLNGVKFAGMFLILAAVFSILTFVLAIINEKLEKKMELVEDTDR